jgi:hypothetical protein
MSEFENATPRPWTLGDEIELRPEGIQVFAWQGPIRVCPATTSSIDDARLIVRAVNAFEPLTEAVTNLLSLVCAHTGPDDAIANAAIEQAEAALTKARGEQ